VFFVSRFSFEESGTDIAVVFAVGRFLPLRPQR
jgi:hypothetical protein